MLIVRGVVSLTQNSDSKLSFWIVSHLSSEYESTLPRQILTNSGQKTHGFFVKYDSDNEINGMPSSAPKKTRQNPSNSDEKSSQNHHHPLFMGI